MGVGSPCDALVALAMVVGTDIEDGVVVAIVPADEFVLFLREREEAIGGSGAAARVFPCLHLSYQP